MSESVSSQDLSRVFAVMRPDMSVALEAVGPALYPSLDSNYNGFKNHCLIACHDFSQDWGMWEMHPAGDEVVVLLSGSATMLLQPGGSELSLRLDAPGSSVVVPRGIWHTALISEPTKMLFVTPGEGTENAAEPR